MGDILGFLLWRQLRHYLKYPLEVRMNRVHYKHEYSQSVLETTGMDIFGDGQECKQLKLSSSISQVSQNWGPLFYRLFALQYLREVIFRGPSSVLKHLPHDTYVSQLCQCTRKSRAQGLCTSGWLLHWLSDHAQFSMFVNIQEQFLLCL